MGRLGLNCSKSSPKGDKVRITRNRHFCCLCHLRGRTRMTKNDHFCHFLQESGLLAPCPVLNSYPRLDGVSSLTWSRVFGHQRYKLRIISAARLLLPRFYARLLLISRISQVIPQRQLYYSVRLTRSWSGHGARTAPRTLPAVYTTVTSAVDSELVYGQCSTGQGSTGRYRAGSTPGSTGKPDGH